MNGMLHLCGRALRFVIASINFLQRNGGHLFCQQEFLKNELRAATIYLALLQGVLLISFAYFRCKK